MTKLTESHGRWAGAVLASLVAVGVSSAPEQASAWWTPAPQPTNTNECVADLGPIQVCQDTGLLGLPSNLGGCCDAVRELARDRCECNPALDLLLGEEGQQIYELEALCRVVQPLKWLWVTPRAIRSCSSLQRHDYGCGPNDMEMDAARLQNVLTFQGIFTYHVNATQCLDTPQFVSDLSTVFEPDVTVFVPYGIGTYTGVDNVAEYLGMAMQSLNHDFWYYDTTIDPTKPAALHVSTDGSTWIQGSTFGGSFLRGDLPYTDAYTEQEVVFEGCSTLVGDYSVIPTEGIRDWVETYVQASELSHRWGVEDICRVHTEYCAGDEHTLQYESEEECIAYISSLPLFSPACGPNRPLAGLSLPCKFKHHFMVPTNPHLHCAHIGPAGMHDMHGALKCDDDYECSDPNEGADWPAVTLIGPNTPQAIRNVFDANNVGWETEPMACAIPTH